MYLWHHDITVSRVPIVVQNECILRRSAMQKRCRRSRCWRWKILTWRVNCSILNHRQHHAVCYSWKTGVNTNECSVAVRLVVMILGRVHVDWVFQVCGRVDAYNKPSLYVCTQNCILLPAFVAGQFCATDASRFGFTPCFVFLSYDFGPLTWQQYCLLLYVGRTRMCVLSWFQSWRRNFFF